MSPCQHYWLRDKNDGYIFCGLCRIAKSELSPDASAPNVSAEVLRLREENKALKEHLKAALIIRCPSVGDHPYACGCGGTGK